MRRLTLVLALAAFVIVGCSDQGQAPTAPTIGMPSVVGPSCPTAPQIRTQILKLFPLGNGLIIAQATFEAIVLKMKAGKTADAQKLATNLIAFTESQYDAGKLFGGTSPATQAKVAALESALTCFVGLTPPNAVDVGVAVVSPTQTTPTTLVTPAALAGIQVQPTDVQQPTLITVFATPDTLLTNLDKYPTNYQFTTSGGQFATPVLTGICVNTDAAPDPARLRLAHNVPDPNPTTIEILDFADPGPLGLNCSQLTLLNDSRNLAVRSLQHLGRGIAQLFSPEPLSAAVVGNTGVGGKTKNLSTFGVVDPQVNVVAVSPTSLTGLPGSSVAAGDLPSVRVSTPLGKLFTNYPVTFGVVGSEGSITGAAALTNGSGVATLASWTLGTALGPDIVSATVNPPHLLSFVQGSPVVFTDNVVSATLVPYEASGYRYSLIGSGSPPSGWETQGFDDSGWSTGAAGFGTGPGSPDGSCTLNSHVQTIWPGAASTSSAQNPEGNSDILVRRSVSVPNGVTIPLAISVAIDNDIQIFVNGTDITASGGGTLVNGFEPHEGCATQGSFVFTAPVALLHLGQSNEIAVRARDRGRTSYFDLQAALAP
jgi:hypothetical protein